MGHPSFPSLPSVQSSTSPVFFTEGNEGASALDCYPTDAIAGRLSGEWVDGTSFVPFVAFCSDCDVPVFLTEGNEGNEGASARDSYPTDAIAGRRCGEWIDATSFVPSVAFCSDCDAPVFFTEGNEGNEGASALDCYPTDAIARRLSGEWIVRTPLVPFVAFCSKGAAPVFSQKGTKGLRRGTVTQQMPSQGG